MNNYMLYTGVTFTDVQEHGNIGAHRAYGRWQVVTLPELRIIHRVDTLAQARLLASLINRVGLARWFPLWRIARIAVRRARPLWTWQEYTYDNQCGWMQRQNKRLIDWLLNRAAASDGDFCYLGVLEELTQDTHWPARVIETRRALRTSALHCRIEAACDGECYCGKYRASAEEAHDEALKVIGATT